MSESPGGIDNRETELQGFASEHGLIINRVSDEEDQSERITLEAASRDRSPLDNARSNTSLASYSLPHAEESRSIVGCL